MANYSFANCLLYKAPYLTHIGTLSVSVLNMRTEGILRLLSGEAIRMHPEDKAALMRSAVWTDFVKRYNAAHDPRLPVFDVFEPLSVKPDDGFLWSPFSDTLCSFTVARCTDGLPYPCLMDPVNIFFRHTTRTDLAHCETQWLRLADRLSHVRRKAVILYPPDTIAPPAFTPEKAAELRAHVNAYNARAVELLAPLGWTVIAPSRVSCPDGAYWAHYSPEVIAEVKERVAKFLA